MAVRAKFRCQSRETFAEGVEQVNYRFSPEYDGSIPEDKRYARYTPAGELRITVTNPDVVFVPGRHYYLDITPVEEIAQPTEGE